MAFAGYLLKFGSFTVPMKWITGYKEKPEQIQDIDAWTDANGELHRDIAPHRRTKITVSFNCLTLAQLQTLRTSFDRIKCSVTYFNTDTFSYSEGIFYVADPEHTIRAVFPEFNEIIFDKFTLDLIEY